MKEMIYEVNSKRELLYNGIYKEHHFYIISYGTHPCCYVEIPYKSKIFKISYMDIESIDVHGGLTYSSDKLYIGNNTILNNSWFIGWDYAHFDDYVSFLDSIDGKKWTTAEMIDECKNVINQIIDIGFKNEKRNKTL